MNQAFVLLSNKHSKQVIDLYNSIFFATLNLGPTYILYHNTTGIPQEIADTRYHAFTDEIFSSLNYIPLADKMIPGSCHFPLMDFYLKNPDFDYYWFIEDDVLYTGEWKNVFGLYDNYSEKIDFSACHIRTYQEEPQWWWWDTLSHPRKFITRELRLRSFNPFFRISNQALSFINTAQLDKWKGHNEVLFPTLLFLEGYTIADLGGNGQFALPEITKIYHDADCSETGDLFTGSMRYRPSINDAEVISNTLYHPIKQSLART